MTWREQKLESILGEIGAVMASFDVHKPTDLTTGAAVRYRDTHLTVGNIRSAEAWNAANNGLAAIEAEAHLQGFEKGLEHAKATYGPGHVLAERQRITEEVEFLTVRSPSDDDKPGWYWDGWHAACAAVLAIANPEDLDR